MDQTTRIIVLIVGLIIVWTLARFLLRLTRRIFTLGCTLVLLLGAILILLSYWR